MVVALLAFEWAGMPPGMLVVGVRPPPAVEVFCMLFAYMPCGLDVAGCCGRPTRLEPPVVLVDIGNGGRSLTPTPLLLVDVVDVGLAPAVVVVVVAFVVAGAVLVVGATVDPDDVVVDWVVGRAGRGPPAPGRDAVEVAVEDGGSMVVLLPVGVVVVVVVAVAPCVVCETRAAPFSGKGGITDDVVVVVEVGSCGIVLPELAVVRAVVVVLVGS